MLRRRQEKPNIKSQIIKALLISTNNDPTATVSLKSIVSQALHQINGLAKFPGSKLSKERFIRATIYQMRNENEIGYEGRNKYKLGPAYRPITQRKLEKLPPEHFKVPTRKRLPETSTPLDPGKKRRHSSELSLSSISGDQFEKARKQFHAAKKLERHQFNPNLPKTRQVNVTLGLPEMPSTSGQVQTTGTAVIVIKEVTPSYAEEIYAAEERYHSSRSDGSVDGNEEHNAEDNGNNSNDGNEDYTNNNNSDIIYEDAIEETESFDEQYSIDSVTENYDISDQGF